MNRLLALSLIAALSVDSIRAEELDAKIAGLDDPALFEQVVKSGEAAFPALVTALTGPRPDLALTPDTARTPARTAERPAQSGGAWPAASTRTKAPRHHARQAWINPSRYRRFNQTPAWRTARSPRR